MLLHLLSGGSSSSGGGGGGGGGERLLSVADLMPRKVEVLAGLAKALDDPNRHVRRLAAAIRNEWAVLS